MKTTFTTGASPTRAGSGRWFRDLKSLTVSLHGIRLQAREEGEEFFADLLDSAARDFEHIVGQAPKNEMPPIEAFCGCLQNVQDQTRAGATQS